MDLPTVARTPDGYRFEVDRVVEVPAGAAWNLVVETRHWPEWGPSVRDVDCSADRIFEGASGRVRLPGGLSVPFEVDSFSAPTDESPGRWTWRIMKIPATGHRVEPLGETQCRVVFEIPLFAAIYMPVCSRALRRMQTILASGQPASKT
jgi:hypothetical protein